jgi:hypothetical protein
MATFVRVQEVEHEIGADGRFSLRVTSPEVELRGVDATTARVRIEFELRGANDAEADEAFETIQYRVNRGGGILEVEEPRRAEVGLGAIGRLLGVSGVRVDARVVAELPRRARVSYAGVSADVTGVGLRGTQEYKTVSGDLSLSDLGGPIRVSGVSGDVSLRAEEPIRLQANTVSGDLSVFAPRIEECRVVTVSGDAELEGDLAAAHHRVETVSGDLSLGLVGGLTLEVRALTTDVSIGVPHRSEGSRDRRRYVIGDGAATLQFSSMSGDVVVHAPRRIAVPPLPAGPRAPERPAPAPPPLGPDEQMAVLRALERGEIDVDEASRRLAGSATDA